MFQTAYPNVKTQYEAGPEGKGKPAAKGTGDEDPTAKKA
jgi:hypothetical protein